MKSRRGAAYAAIVCADSAGRNALRQLGRVATGWRPRAVAPPLIVCTHAQTNTEILTAKRLDQASLVRGEELGATLAAGLAQDEREGNFVGVP